MKTAYNYGDRGRTMVAATVDDATEGTVRHSGYHDMDRVVETEDGDDEPDAKTDRAVILLV